MNEIEKAARAYVRVEATKLGGAGYDVLEYAIRLAKAAFLAGAEHAGARWIKVADKLPAQGDVVIVANARGWVGAADFLHDCFYDVTSECSDPMTRVTHWMPMPSWPGEIEEND